MAIAFDASSGVSVQASGTSITLAHTCTGTDRMLFVHVWCNDTDRTYTATYNGVSMTEVKSQTNAGSGMRTKIFALQAPATGTNNIVVTASSATNFAIVGTSYTGVLQSVTMDATHGTTTASGTSHSDSITTVADNCWVIGCFGGGSGASTYTAGASTTSRCGTGVVSPFVGDNNAAKTPAGSVTLTATTNNNQTVAICLVSFAPATAVATGNFFPFF